MFTYLPTYLLTYLTYLLAYLSYLLTCLLIRKGVECIIPVVLEPAACDTRLWQGAVGMKLGSKLYFNRFLTGTPTLIFPCHTRLLS